MAKWYPNKDNPYHGIFVHRQAISLLEHHRVFVFYAKSANQKEFIQKEESIEDGISIVRYYYRKKIIHISIVDKFIKLFLYYWCYIQGRRHFKKKEIRFDIIHFHILGRTSILAFFSKLPYLISEHWSGYFPERNQYTGRIRKWFDKHAVKKAKRIICVSEAQKNAMISHQLIGEYKVINNVVDEHFFDNNLSEFRERQFVVVADQDDEVKNIRGILNVFKLFLKSHSGFKLTVIGDGKDTIKLKEHAETLEIAACVDFMGGQEKEIISREISKSYALILFSNFENSPCVIGESFACGVPVIGTNVGGLHELIKDDSGMLIPPGNERQLLEAMNKLIKTTYHAQNLRRIAKDKMSSVYIGEQISNIYNTI